MILGIAVIVVLLLGALFKAPPPAVAPVRTQMVSAPPTEPEPHLHRPPVFSRGMEEITKLAENHVDEQIIRAFISSSKIQFGPTADEVIYLTDLGVPQPVIASLFDPRMPPPSPTAPAPAAAQPIALAPTISTPVSVAEPIPTAENSFHDALSPYGPWRDVPEIGDCWQPSVAINNPQWRPYVDQGQWIMTEAGWYWQSAYAWGWAPFHYGRWTKVETLGWVWVPDHKWGPAWVAWRSTKNYTGWAPLAPGMGLFQAEVLSGITQSLSLDPALPAGWFNFVEQKNILQAKLDQVVAKTVNQNYLYTHSIAVNNNASIIKTAPSKPVLSGMAQGVTNRELGSHHRHKEMEEVPKVITGVNPALLLHETYLETAQLNNSRSHASPGSEANRARQELLAANQPIQNPLSASGDTPHIAPAPTKSIKVSH